MRSEFRKWINTVLAVLLLVGMLPFRGTQTVAENTASPKISVIIPVYNVEPYLRQCLDSVVNQTLKDIEIICIDDGSPDNCGEILDEYAAKDSRFIVIHQENKGPSEARNKGLEVATGAYTTFVDSDDYIELNTYEETYKIACQHNADVLSFGKKNFLDEGYVAKLPIDSNNDYAVKINDSSDLQRVPKIVFVTTQLYKSSIIKENNLKFIKMRPSEDTTFNLMIKPLLKTIVSIKDVFYYRRVQPTSTMQTYDRSIREKTIGITQFEDLHLCLNAIPEVCNAWRKSGAVKGNEVYLLTSLIEQTFRRFRILLSIGRNYAQQILDSFGSDIYNNKTVKKCNKSIQKLIRELEYAAQHPKDFQSDVEETNNTATKKNAPKKLKVNRLQRKSNCVNLRRKVV